MIKTRKKMKRTAGGTIQRECGRRDTATERERERERDRERQREGGGRGKKRNEAVGRVGSQTGILFSNSCL